MNTKHIKFCCVILAAINFFSCISGTNSNPSNSADSSNRNIPIDTFKINFTPVRVVIDTTDHNLTTNRFFLFNASPYKQARRFWRGMYSDCKLSGIDYNISDFDFFGAGSPKGIGTVIDSETMVSKLPLDTNIFSKSELKQIIQYGDSIPCKSTSSSNLAISTILSGDFKIGNMDSALAVSVKAAFSKKNSLTYFVKSWQKIELNTTWLAHFLQTGENLSNKQVYLHALTQPGNLIIAKAIYINGFSFDIGFSDSLSVAIQAALKQNPTVNFGSLSLQLSVSSQKQKTITASSTGSFAIYTYTMSGTKIN